MKRKEDLWEKTPVCIKWNDSYGPINRWTFIDEFDKPKPMLVTSYGIIIEETPDTVALAQSYSPETTYTTEQALGILMIPKKCIKHVVKLVDLKLKYNCGTLRNQKGTGKKNETGRKQKDVK